MTTYRHVYCLLCFCGGVNSDPLTLLRFILFVHEPLLTQQFYANSMADFSDLKAITEKALSVYRTYYAKLDGNQEARQSLLEFFAPANQDGSVPILEWNGYRLFTQQEVSDYLRSLPKTKHEVRCADAQPLPGCSEDADNFFITLSGVCTIDDEHIRKYFQRLVVHKRESKYYIVSDYYRWTGSD
jgi:hypothetical protein